MFDYSVVLEQQQRMIEEDGQAIQFVRGTTKTRDWAYTIGRLRRGLPELVVVGLDPRTSARLLNETDYHWSELLEMLEDATLAETVGYTLLPIPARVWRTTDYLLGAANDARRMAPGRPLEAMQLVWATDEGLFPWDPDIDRSLRYAQPILGLLPE